MSESKLTTSASRLAREIRRMVGALPEGSRLPTVRQLMRDYGVSQHLVQTALQRLRAEGAISSFVGRGTFVGSGAMRAARPRSVLTLMHQSPYERGDRIVETLHRELIRKGHSSLLLTYYDHQHAMAMLRNGERYDACVLQPRSSVISAELLALLRQVSDCVAIESHAADNFDVDAISNDPEACVDLALDHLRALGHTRIAWLTEAGPNYFFRACARFFVHARKWAAIGAADMPRPTPTGRA
jgi:DNA-binding transcriptional regulator YhcF (GntR family)